MKLSVPLAEAKTLDQAKVGGKCRALAQMWARGIPVPDTVCIPEEAYRRYVGATGLRERIQLELSRKDFADMRWEELWDAALRIRNMFLKADMPADLRRELSEGLEERFGEHPVVVRSSAPGEDSAAVSFAGLHESFVNVKGMPAILEHVRLVWSSLWSDAALLYRRDLGLDVAKSTMAVAVQELVRGDRSGVAFSRSPNDDAHAVVESVYGLNQGLVDGTVEPDRWILEREGGRFVSHAAPAREERMVVGDTGVVLEPLPEWLSDRPPLAPEEVEQVFRYARKLETAFGRPQDVEWTWGKEGLVVLQSRPVTTPAGSESDDGRRWYLSLRRSFDNLTSLRQRIEGELIPGMIAEAEALAAQAVEGLSDVRLADEIEHRLEIYDQWVDVYWEAFIPFAHGIRLFGQVYNDAVRPDDPYAFMDLLAGTDMASLARNETLEALASMVRQDAELREALEEGAPPAELTGINEAFSERVRGFVEQFGDLSCPMTGSGTCDGPPDSLVSVLLEMAKHEPRRTRNRQRDREAMETAYLGHFSGEERMRAAELLDLARTSYRLRDDDNIYLGRIEAQVEIAVEEGRRRLSDRNRLAAEALSRGDVARALSDPDFVPDEAGDEEPVGDMVVQARQIVGQPAGPGLAQGRARVIRSASDLTSFEHGDVLVCDAVDPNMTFVVPLASAVVERRGGMLIHGAIIAREYGLPCVTGVPDATERIQTGDLVTVDGYLGIITIAKRGGPSDAKGR